MEGLREDLRIEGDVLDRLVVKAGPAVWECQTPAPGWTVGHQIGHLTATDEKLILALEDPDEFRRRWDEEDASNPARIDVEATARFAEGQALAMARWRASRAEVLDVTSTRDPRERLPWFGPEMSLHTALTARYMETWAHAHDVADALSVDWTARQGIRHVITLAVLARDFAFQLHGLVPPAEQFRITLTSPDGSEWTWGPYAASQEVLGLAEDFALMAVRRLHRQDGRVVARGAEANRWLDLVQAYAGPPGSGRQPDTTSDAGR